MWAAKRHGKLASSMPMRLANVLAISILASACNALPAAAQPTETHNQAVDAGGIRAEVTPEGDITPIILSGNTQAGRIRAWTRTDPGWEMDKSVAFLPASAGVSFVRSYRHDGRWLTVRETLSPEPANQSLKWEIEINGATDETVMLETHLAWTDAGAALGFWTAWQESGAGPFASTAYKNPLQAMPLRDASYTLGDEMSVPIATFMDASKDLGVSLIQSPLDFLMDTRLRVAQSGEVEFSRKGHRLNGLEPLRFTVYITAHKADWRDGLGRMTRLFPDAFNPANEKAYQVDGVKVPAGGWNSEKQEPRIDTWTGVQDHVIYRTKLMIPARAAGRCVKLLLGAVNFGAEIWIDGRKVGEHAGCMTPLGCHAYRMQHYDPITPGGDRLRGMEVHCWEIDGMEPFAVAAPVLRLKDWTHFAPWSWVNYWPNFLEGMSHDRHPWTQNNHADRRDGVDGWDSPVVAAIQRAFHPFLVVDTNTLNLNPTIKKYSLDLTVRPPQATAYSAGSHFRRSFEVFNGALTGRTLKLRWTARWDRADGQKAAQGTVGSFEIEPGFHQPQTVEFRVPKPGREKRVLFLVLESIKEGKVVCREDRSCFTVTAESPQSELPRHMTAASIPEIGLITVHPREIEAPLVNPYCGWGIWSGPRFFDSRPFSVEYNTKGFGDDAPLFGWVLIDWMWSDLEPKEGQFEWKDLDAIIDYWKARNKQLVVRLWVTTDPGWAGAPGNKACPDWLWDTGVKYHEYKAEGGVKQRCPAYADPTWETLYLPRMKRFLSAYRDRYEKHDSNIIVDHVMGFGDWGEWHTMWSHYPWPSREKKREVLRKAIAAYLDVFAPNQPPNEPVRSLAIAQVYDEDCGGDTPLDEAIKRQALDLALARGFALTRNGFIDRLSGWPNDLMNKYWSDHQLIGEGNWSYEQVKKDKTHGSMADHVDAFVRFHSAYAHLYLHSASYRQAMADDRGEFERALRPKGIGYRFVITLAEWEATRHPGQTLTLRQEWVNRNAGWCVYPYRLRLFLMNSGGAVAWSQVDQKFDPRSWLAGTTYPVESAFRLPADLKPGDYELRVALVDEAGRPQVRLGVEGADPALRYGLGLVRIANLKN